MIQANGYADLHLHTNHSDGYYSPKELIDKTLLRGLKTVSIVDHDEIGISRSRFLIRLRCRLKFIPARESHKFCFLKAMKNV